MRYVMIYLSSRLLVSSICGSKFFCEITPGTEALNIQSDSFDSGGALVVGYRGRTESFELTMSSSYVQCMGDSNFIEDRIVIHD